MAPVPAYIPEWYGVESTTDEYPLALGGFHYRGRLHSSWGGIEELKEATRRRHGSTRQMRSLAASSRGDTIHVKNEFGTIELLAKVTPRVIPGMVAISQGAWHDADMSSSDHKARLDKGGSINTLTTHRPSPLAKGNPQHSNICEVVKA